MSDSAPSLQLAPGLHARTLDNGTVYVEPSGEHKDQTVAFRVTASQYATQILPFRETFPQSQLGIAMRWLLDQPEVRKLIDDRIASTTR